MWINAEQIAKVLDICIAKSYQIINDLKKEQKEQGYYTNPNAKVPIAFFCDKFGLNKIEVREMMATKNQVVNV